MGNTGRSDLAHMFVLNPLPVALHHYEVALVRHLWPDTQVVHLDFEVGGVSRSRKLKAVSTAIWGLLRLVLRRRAALVIWPSFGLAELALWRLSRGARVVIIHDPVPLRRQVGYSKAGRVLGRWGARGRRVSVVTHTQLAADALTRVGITPAAVLPHPILAGSRQTHRRSRTVLVAGQSKESRDVALLCDVAPLLPADLTLQIAGRGWPDVPGWSVDSRFLTEEELDQALGSAGVVLIPYRYYFQSGIATRALELGTAVVAARHEFIESLYGPSWPGICDEQSPQGWADAITRTLSQEAPTVEHVAEQIGVKWRRSLPGLLA